MFFKNTTGPPGRNSGESGHLLLIVMMGLTVMAIMLAAAVQQWSTVQRRENEKELIFRGNQYVKAIRLYQKEHGGALPTSLESLAEPGPRGLRYIRKLFRDPMSPPEGKWGILLADPSGKGYINPNAPPPPEEGVEGLEDLGKGLSPSKLDKALHTSSIQNTAKEKRFAYESGGSAFTAGPARDSQDSDLSDKSVTAPGQPVGPIVGVVSLADFSSSFRIWRDHESYGEWAFNIFETGDGQNTQQQPLAPVATPGSGIGPGGSQTILGGAGGPVGGSAPNIGFPGKPKK
ncbi:MAG TPA: type II secretion system protein [Candidatus Polarisedimenticolia bacterium]|jgi:type II secretory pathway pseudopilin PulG|nr:type II secretion system protein [Candidatus Polarisedimenticolia bacterium]